jgi:cellulose synthase/poly-beta-1,6-N-acetylglucosamine synthase-like glycosyltransferase
MPIFSAADKIGRNLHEKTQSDNLPNKLQHRTTSLLSVILLTKNEEINLPNTLASLRKLEADTFVVDSGSTDQTVTMARQLGCQVFEHPFEIRLNNSIGQYKICPSILLGSCALMLMTPYS